MEINLAQVAIGVGIFLAGLILSGAVMAFLLVRLPQDYFSGPERGMIPRRYPAAVRILLLVLKNLLGLVLVILGIALSIPGVPGQGFLTIFLGLLLLDIPGKYRLERRLVRIPALYRGINWIRGRFGKPPMKVDGVPATSP